MASSVENSIRDYFNRLHSLIDTFNFTRPGKDKSMGLDAAHLVAEGILDRSINQQAGPSGPWLANDPDYTIGKVKKYNVDLIGVRTGQMLSLPSLLGKIDLTPDTVLIQYGTGLPPSSSMSSGYISKADTSISDIEKAYFFTRLKGGFFELDTTIADKVKGYFADELMGFIRELNSR